MAQPDKDIDRIVFQFPQMRRMGGCITEHDKCVEHNILLSQVSNNFI